MCVREETGSVGGNASKWWNNRKTSFSIRKDEFALTVGRKNFSRFPFTFWYLGGEGGGRKRKDTRELRYLFSFLLRMLCACITKYVFANFTAPHSRRHCAVVASRAGRRKSTTRRNVDFPRDAHTASRALRSRASLLLGIIPSFSLQCFFFSFFFTTETFSFVYLGPIEAASSIAVSALRVTSRARVITKRLQLICARMRAWFEGERLSCAHLSVSYDSPVCVWAFECSKY